METTLLFSLLDDKEKQNRALKDWKGKSVMEFMNYCERMQRLNKPYRLIYEKCRKFIFEHGQAGASVQLSIWDIEDAANNNSSLKQLSPKPLNCEFTIPEKGDTIIEKLRDTIEKVVVWRERDASSAKEKTIASYFREYFVDGMDPDEIAARHDVVVETINVQVRKFVDRLFQPLKEREPRLDEAYKNEIAGVRHNILGKKLQDVEKEIGLSHDLKKRFLTRFLKIDIMKLDSGIELMVNSESVTQTRKALNVMLQMLKKEFKWTPVALLFDYLGESLEDEQKERLLDAYFKSLDIFEWENDKIRIRQEKIELEYVRQERIIYESEQPLNSSMIRKIYEETYGEPMKEFNANYLGQNGFVCVGTFWTYGRQISSVTEIIEDYVERNRYRVKLSEVKAIVRVKKLEVEDSTIETYLSQICYRSLNDPDDFVHKEHEADYPDFRRRARKTRGQENKLVNALWHHLEDKKDGENLKDTLRWARNFALENGLNGGVVNQIVYHYTSPTNQAFIVTDGKISCNPQFDPEILKFSGLGKTKKNYAQKVIDISVAKLLEEWTMELPYIQIQKAIWEEIGEKNIRRNAIISILKSTPGISVVNDKGRLSVRLDRDKLSLL